MKAKIRKSVNQRYLHKETAHAVEQEVLQGLSLLKPCLEFLYPGAQNRVPVSNFRQKQKPAAIRVQKKQEFQALG